jgi:hypothetical protein
VPYRQVRAAYSADIVRVYQAYGDDVADSALQSGTFAGPAFRMDRMTWIKPSFLWMMHRSGWATKLGQTRILAVDIERSGFDDALAEACLTAFQPTVHGSLDNWKLHIHRASVRVQWDPERDMDSRALAYRTIQIGLSGDAIRAFTSMWIRSISDITPCVVAIRAMVHSGDIAAATRLLPVEVPYPVTAAVARSIGAESTGRTDRDDRGHHLQ